VFIDLVHSSWVRLLGGARLAYILRLEVLGCSSQVGGNQVLARDH